MKQTKFFAMLLVMMAAMMTFTACGDDDDDKIDSFGDFYIEFELVDRGTLSSSDASQLIGSLNSIDASMEGVSKEEAEYYFDRMVKELKEEWDEENSFSITFKMKLMNEGKTVKSKTFYLTKTGCTVK